MMEKMAQTDETFTQVLLEQAVDLNAQLLNLPIYAEDRDSILSHFRQISQMAQLVNEFPLSEQAQPAPTFEP